MIGPSYRRAIGSLPAELGRVARYHAGWWDDEGRARARAGKAVRPALVLASARAAGADRGVPVPEVVEAAVAVELAHDFTLLHDDVMDGDRTRRGHPAAWTVFGTSLGILAGDALLVLALKVLDNRAGAPVLTQALLELCAGQAADLAFETRQDVGLPECLAMAEALLGVWGGPIATGKPASSDLASRKKSLPVVAALTSGTAAGERLARMYQREQDMDEHAIAHAAELIEAAGGKTWAQQEAERRIVAALDALTAAHPDPAATTDLHALAALITRRDR